MSELVEKRIAFTYCVGELLAFAEKYGYRVVLCEAMRAPQQAEWNATHCAVKSVSGVRCERLRADPIHGREHIFRPVGIRGTLHQMGLAIDLLIMVQGQDGAWKIDERIDGYRALGDYWKTLHELARAGVDFGDSGHFGFEHDGRK